MTKAKYPVLQACMQTKKLDIYKLANATGTTIQSVYNKLKGKTDWSLNEALKIKEALDYKESIETLFYCEVKGNGKEKDN